MIVLDASVAVSWLFNEATPLDDLDRIVATQRIVVPAHWGLEIGHATLKALRRTSIPQERLTTIAEGLDALNVTIEPPLRTIDIMLLVTFAREQGLTMYDAAYVQLALTRQAELATLDNAMRGAALRVGVKLVPAQ